MDCKRFMTLFLSIMLFFSSINAYCLSYASLKEAATQLISNDIVGKIAPFALFACFTGLFFWLNQRSNVSEENEFLDDESDAEKVNNEEVNKKITQLPIYRQNSADGGGPNSCGYHALLRAMQIVSSKHNNENEGILLVTLSNSESIKTYFGTQESEWKKNIIQKRKKGKINNLIYNFSKKDDSNSYISKIIRLLGIGANKDENKDSVEKAKEILSKTDDFDNMYQQLLVNNNISDLVKQKITAINEEHEDGEGLNEGEIEFLWKESKNIMLPPHLLCDIKTIPNFSIIGEECDDVTPHIKEIKKEKLVLNQEYFHIFVIGNMQQIGDRNGTYGHWYSLVMHHKQDMSRDYYIIDSSSFDRAFDKNAHRLISMIEAKKS